MLSSLVPVHSSHTPHCSSPVYVNSCLLPHNISSSSNITHALSHQRRRPVHPKQAPSPFIPPLHKVRIQTPTSHVGNFDDHLPYHVPCFRHHDHSDSDQRFEGRPGSTQEALMPRRHVLLPRQLPCVVTPVAASVAFPAREGWPAVRQGQADRVWDLTTAVAAAHDHDARCGAWKHRRNRVAAAVGCCRGRARRGDCAARGGFFGTFAS